MKSNDYGNKRKSGTDKNPQPQPKKGKTYKPKGKVNS